MLAKGYLTLSSKGSFLRAHQLSDSKIRPTLLSANFMDCANGCKVQFYKILQKKKKRTENKHKSEMSTQDIEEQQKQANILAEWFCQRKQNSRYISTFQVH